MPVIGPQADDLPSPSPSGSGHVGSYAILCAAAKQLRREQLRSSKGSDTVAAAGLPGIMSPTLTPRQALGLGLPLARGLIRNHGRFCARKDSELCHGPVSQAAHDAFKLVMVNYRDNHQLPSAIIVPTAVPPTWAHIPDRRIRSNRCQNLRELKRNQSPAPLSLYEILLKPAYQSKIKNH